MRVAICADIHGNKQAFEAVIAAAETDGADELWCLGDLVGYGAEPDACVALAEAHCTVCLAGNHDLAVVDVLSLEDFSRGAALAAARVHSTAAAADSEKVEMSSSPSTARSWLPHSVTAQRSRTSSVQPSGWAP